MSLTILPELLQGSEEWHDQRRGLVTASVVGRLLTVSHLGAIDYGCGDCGALPGESCISKRGGAPIKTVHSQRTDTAAANRATSPLVIEPADTDESRGLTALLVAERITGFTEPTYISSDMFRGITDEPIAREVYAANYAPVTEVGFMVLERDGWRLGFSPDGLVGDDGLIEIKSRRSKVQLMHVLAGEVPAANMAQIQAGLLVSGRAWCDYVSYSGGMNLWVKRVTPDERWFTAIESAVRAFEKTATEMADRYLSAVKGLPETERIDYNDEAEIRL